MLTVGYYVLADPQFSLPFNNSNEQGLKTVAIKGFAKFKPGGSALMLSLLIQGQPGTMPGSAAPGSMSSTASPTPSGGSSSSPSQSPGPTASPASPTPTSGGTGGHQGNGKYASPASFINDVRFGLHISMDNMQVHS